MISMSGSPRPSSRLRHRRSSRRLPCSAASSRRADARCSGFERSRSGRRFDRRDPAETLRAHLDRAAVAGSRGLKRAQGDRSSRAAVRGRRDPCRPGDRARSVGTGSMGWLPGRATPSWRVRVHPMARAVERVSLKALRRVAS